MQVRRKLVISVSVFMLPSLCISHTIAIVANQSEERSQARTALLDHAYRSFFSDNYPSCLFACLKEIPCKSFNFWWENFTCDLNTKDKYSAHPIFFKYDVLSTHMGLMREPAGTVHNHVFNLQLFSLILPWQTDQSNFSLQATSTSKFTLETDSVLIVMWSGSHTKWQE